jgi:hypothetical protein
MLLYGQKMKLVKQGIMQYKAVGQGSKAVKRDIGYHRSRIEAKMFALKRLGQVYLVDALIVRWLTCK